MEEKELEIEVKKEVSDSDNKNENENNPNTVEENKNNAFDIIAWVSFFVGLATLITACFGFGLFVFWIGIIISIIGKKSIKQRKKADYGLLFSIFSFVVTLALFLFT